MKWLKSCLICIALFTLASCGGGGSDGGGSGGNGGGSSVPTLSFSQKSLTFLSELGAMNPNDQTFTVSVRNSESITDTVYVFIELPDDAFYDVDLSITGTSGEFSVGVTSANSIGLGVHNSEFTIRVCLDSQCNNEVGGSPQTIQLQYTVEKPSITAFLTSNQLSAKQGIEATIDLMRIHVTNFSGEVGNGFFENLNLEISYLDEQSDWLIIQQITNNEFSLKTVGNIPTGTYKANIMVSSTENYKPKDILITYVVTENDTVIDNPAVSFSINASSILADLSHQLTVKSDRNWQAQSDSKWLTLTSDPSNDNLNIALNEELTALKNGDHVAQLSLIDTQDDSVIYHFTVNLSLATVQFDYVQPYYGYKTTQTKLTVNGEGFNSLAGAPIFLGDSFTSEYQVIDDNQLSLVFNNDDTDTYKIGLNSPIDNFTSKAQYSVVDSVSLPAATYASNGFSTSTPVFEPNNASLFYIAGGANDEILMCLRPNQAMTNWQSYTVLDFNGSSYVKNMILSVDGKWLYVHAQVNDGSGTDDPLYKINTDCSSQGEIIIDSLVQAGEVYFDNAMLDIALTDEALVLVDSYHKKGIKTLNIVTNQAHISELDDSVTDKFWRELYWFQSSYDGSYLELLTVYSENKPAILDTSDHSLTLLDIGTADAISNYGNYRIRNGNEVYDQNESLLGQLESNYSQYRFNVLTDKLLVMGDGDNYFEYDFNQAPIDGVFQASPVIIDQWIKLKNVSPDIKNYFKIDNENLVINPL